LARSWRIQYGGAYYHVLSRGNEGRDIFFDDGDRNLFLSTLGETSERFKVDVFSFVLMRNHYHLLLRTTLPNLSRAMQWLGLTYARRLNNRLGRCGHLFQGRFKAMVVESDAYVVELSCYIHRNPLRAKRVKRLIEYPWSSYPVYAYGKKGPEWLKTDLILSYFGGRGGHKAYREKVQDYAGEEGRLWEDFRHGVILGSAGFVESIRLSRGGTAPHKEIPQQKKVLRSIDLMGAAKRASALLGREMNGYAPGQRVRGEIKEDRDLVLYALWEIGAFQNEEIGQVFGVSYSAVSHIVRDMKEQIKKDSRVGSKVKRINSQFKMGPQA
jgi:putative transposase